MELKGSIDCPKCGRVVADSELAQGASGGTVLCKGCGALISVEDAQELEAKGELDADFDLDICFEDGVADSAEETSELGGAGMVNKEPLPAPEANEAAFSKEEVRGVESLSATVSELSSESDVGAKPLGDLPKKEEPVLEELEDDADAKEHERWELPPKREPELPPTPTANEFPVESKSREGEPSSNWKWSKDDDFDPLRDLPRRDAAGGGNPSAGGSAPMADLPAPPSRSKGTEESGKEKNVPPYELPPREKVGNPDSFLSDTIGVGRAVEAGRSASASADGDRLPRPPSRGDVRDEAGEGWERAESPEEGSALAAASASRRRRRPAAKTSRTPVFMIVLACLILLIGGGAWFVLPRFDFGSAGDFEELTSEETLRRFLTAETSNERVGYIWKVDELRPRAEAYYAKNGYGRPDLGGLRKMSEIEMGDFEGVLVADAYEAQLSIGGATVCYVIRKGEQVLGVDWESFEDVTPTPFADFQAERMPKGTVFRAHAFQDDALWTGRFDDPNRWYCLRLESPKGTWSVFAYAEKSSIIGEQIRQIFNFTDNEIMTVVLAYPDGAEGEAEDQVLLQRIVSLDWLTEQ
ncbi:MAG: hypothetical protein AAGD22_02540 [Verrucomicrobiota bacterium]